MHQYTVLVFFFLAYFTLYNSYGTYTQWSITQPLKSYNFLKPASFIWHNAFEIHSCWFIQFVPFFLLNGITLYGFPGGSVLKNPSAKQQTQVRSQGQVDSLEEDMATHSSILAWEIPWAEESGGLQSMGSKSWT